MFSHQGPIKLSCTTLEQSLERRSHGSLMRCVELIQPIQLIVVVSDDFVCWLEIEHLYKVVGIRRPDKSGSKPKGEGQMKRNADLRSLQIDLAEAK